MSACLGAGSPKRCPPVPRWRWHRGAWRSVPTRPPPCQPLATHPQIAPFPKRAEAKTASLQQLHQPMLRPAGGTALRSSAVSTCSIAMRHAWGFQRDRTPSVRFFKSTRCRHQMQPPPRSPLVPRQALARVPDRHGKLSISMMSLSRRTAFVNANHRPSGLTVTFWSGPQS